MADDSAASDRGAMGSLRHARLLRRQSLRLVGFEYVVRLTTCSNRYTHDFFLYLCGGFDHGYRQRRAHLVAGIDNLYNPLCRFLPCVGCVWGLSSDRLFAGKSRRLCAV